MKRECDRLDKPEQGRQNTTTHCDLGREAGDIAAHEEGSSLWSQNKSSILGIPKSLSTSINQWRMRKKCMVKMTGECARLEKPGQERQNTTMLSRPRGSVACAGEMQKNLPVMLPHACRSYTTSIQQLFNNYSTSYSTTIQQLHIYGVSRVSKASIKQKRTASFIFNAQCSKTRIIRVVE